VSLCLLCSIKKKDIKLVALRQWLKRKIFIHEKFSILKVKRNTLRYDIYFIKRDWQRIKMYLKRLSNWYKIIKETLPKNRKRDDTWRSTINIFNLSEKYNSILCCRNLFCSLSIWTWTRTYPTIMLTLKVLIRGEEMMMNNVCAKKRTFYVLNSIRLGLMTI
jgi:hypothetical protein